jgi:hypothetical protein
MLSRVALATALTAAVVTIPVGGTAAAPSAPVADTAVSSWDAVGSQAFTAAALSPAEGHVIFAYASIAVYDAVVAARPGYEPFAVRAAAPARTSPEAAVAASAHAVLAHYLPAQAPGILDPAYAEALRGIPDGPPKAHGVALGERVAASLIARRADDGFRAPVAHTPPDPPVPGAWLPTAATPPVGTYLGRMRPFALRSADQFRPAGPPALGSRRWARDYAEVRAVGSATSTARSESQTTAARFWAEPPVQQARNGFRRFVADHDLDVVQAARFMAMASVVYADGFVACFEAKYHHAFWRPVTAIRAGDTDGNDATVADPAWTPLLPTPNHPDYPSAHSCITPAAGIVAAEFLGTRRIDLTIPSLTGLGDRHFDTGAQLQADVGNARVWGGIHFRSAVEAGATIARRTAAYVLARHFRPLPCRHDAT